MLSPTQTRMLRALSIGDEGWLRRLLAADVDRPSMIDPRVGCLVRLAAVIAVDAAQPAYQREVQRSLDAGATTDEILDVLFAVAADIGSSRVIAVAPKLALALGYDVDQGLESLVERD